MAMTFTGRQLITRAGTLVGIWSQGETPSAADMQDALAILNGLLDGLNTQRLTIPSSTRTVFSFTAATSTYTIGPGGDWDTVRPISIDTLNVLALTATPSFEISVGPLTEQMYNDLSIKDLTAPFPTNFYYDATFPLGQVFVWPTPTDVTNYEAVLYVATQLTGFTDLGADVVMPPAYYRMLYYNLALELAPAFQRPLDAAIVKFAADSLGDVKRNNLVMMDLASGAALPGTGGIYDIYSDSNY